MTAEKKYQESGQNAVHQSATVVEEKIVLKAAGKYCSKICSYCNDDTINALKCFKVTFFKDSIFPFFMITFYSFDMVSIFIIFIVISGCQNEYACLTLRYKHILHDASIFQSFVMALCNPR